MTAVYENILRQFGQNKKIKMNTDIKEKKRNIKLYHLNNTTFE